MSVLDKVNRAKARDVPNEHGQTSTGKLSTPLPDDPPVIRRLRIVLGQLMTFAASNRTGKYSKFAWVMDSMMDEVIGEITDNGDTASMEQWMVDFGKVVQWCGSGDDDLLPDGVREYLKSNYPTELVAIEA